MATGTPLSLVLSSLLLCAPAWSAPAEREPAPPPSGERNGPTFVQPPTLLPAPHADTPLVALVELTASVPVRVRLFASSGPEHHTLVPQASFRAHQVVPVLGLPAGTTWSIVAEIRDESGGVATSAPLSYTTAALPSDFPPLHVVASQPARMEPGLTLFAATPSSGSGTYQPYVVLLDARGEVVWFHHPPGKVSDLRETRAGTLLYLDGDADLREIDFLGAVRGEWWAANLETNVPPGAIAVPIDTMHHEAYELPPGYAGDFLVLSTELRTLPDYPSSETDPTQTTPTAEVVGDVIVEFRRDGTIVREWKLLDILDPYRISYDSLSGFWNSNYGTTTYDWSHANAVVPVPADDSILVSCRHQDAVVKIEASGAIDWIFGDPTGWNQPWAASLLKLSGEGATWFYHQHAATVTPRNRVMLFDNGVYRAIPPAPQLPLQNRTSRALELAVDPLDHTARPTWQYAGATPFYSSVVGDADPLPLTDDVLVTSGSEELASGQRYARVLEVDRGSGDVVFEIDVRDDTNDPPTDWLVYRADRIPALYPAVRPGAPGPQGVRKP